MSQNDENPQYENNQQARLKNNSVLFTTNKVEQKSEYQNVDVPQLSHRGQVADCAIKQPQKQQKTKADNQFQNQLNQNLIQEALQNTNTCPLPQTQSTQQNQITSNFIQMLQINAQRKNKANNQQGIQQQLVQQNNITSNKVIINTNSNAAATSPASFTASEFYTLDKQQNNINPQHNFASSAGFNSPNNNIIKKINQKLGSSTSTNKFVNQKKLFESSGPFNSNSIGINQQKKSNSLQRQMGNSKQQQNQYGQNPILNKLAVATNEYYSKLVQNNKQKETNQSESTTKETGHNTLQDSLHSSQNMGAGASQINNQEKIEIEKAVEEEYLDNIKQINIDIILKKKLNEDQTNQFLNLLPSQNKSSAQNIQKNDPNAKRKSSDKKGTINSQKLMTSSYVASRNNYEHQPSSAKKMKSSQDIKKSQWTSQNRNSFEVGFSSTGTDFYKSNSLSKQDQYKKNSQNLIQNQKKNIPAKSVSAQVKKQTDSPQQKSKTLQKPKPGIKTIFSSSTKLTQSLQSHPNSSTKGRGLSKEIKNKQQLENSLRALGTPVTTSNVQSKKQSEEISLSTPSQHESPYQTGLSQYVSQVKQSQINDHDKIDNIDVDLKLSKKASREVHVENKASLNDRALQYSDLESNQTDVQSRKNRIETPINLGFCYYNTSMDMHNRYPNPEDYFCNIFREHFIQSFNALNFCRTLSPVDELILESKYIEIPPHPTKKKTVIFDLDETLIHCNEDPNIYSDVIISIQFPNGEIVQAGINIRPYAKECLRELSKYFEVIVFTASHSCYAERVIEYLDPNRQYIDLVLSRDNCVQTQEGVHIKDLRIFKNRDLKNIVIIDNAAYSFGFQIENGIPIIPFFDNKRDMELKYLVDFLKKLLEKDDVRTFLHKTFKMNIYSECDTIEEALERIYDIKQQQSRVDLEEQDQKEIEVFVQNNSQQNLQYVEYNDENQYGQYDDEDDDLERDDDDNDDLVNINEQQSFETYQEQMQHQQQNNKEYEQQLYEQQLQQLNGQN